MSLKYFNKHTDQIAVITGLSWSSRIEQPNEELRPTAAILSCFPVVHFFYVDDFDTGRKMSLEKGDFLKTHNFWTHKPWDVDMKVRELVEEVDCKIMSLLAKEERKNREKAERRKMADEKPVEEMTEEERAREIEEIDYKIMNLVAEKKVLEIVPGLVEKLCKNK